MAPDESTQADRQDQQDTHRYAATNAPTLRVDTQGRATRASSAGKAPAQIGRYVILDPIARGGMGVVYRARQEDLDRIVALKLLLQGELADADDQERFLLEARAVGRLSHPGIVHVHEVGLFGEQPYFAMEFIEGPPLSRIIETQRITPRRALGLMADIAAAVQYAHEQKILHRDLKPANILVREGDHPVITDFGLAKDMDQDSRLTATGVALGTPSYMAPEQARGERAALGPWTDTYALGAILYELMALQPPFTGATPGIIIHKVLSEDPAPLRKLVANVPQELEWICQKALEKDIARRYRSAAAFQADVRAALDGAPLQAHARSMLYRLKKRVQRNPPFYTLVACALVAAAIVPAAWTVHAARQRRASIANLLTAARSSIRSAPGEALASVNEALRLEPDHFEALHLRALAMRTGSPPAAVQDLKRCLAQNPAHAASRLALAEILSAQGQPAEALEALEPLRRAEPDHMGARLLEARLRWALGEPGRGAALAGQVAARAPQAQERAQAWLLMARIALAASDLVHAAEHAAKAQETRPALESRLLLAEIAGQRHEFAAMREHTQAVLELAPGDREGQILNAIAQDETEGLDLSGKRWLPLRTLFPDDPRIHMRIAQVRLLPLLEADHDEFGPQVAKLRPHLEKARTHVGTDRTLERQIDFLEVLCDLAEQKPPARKIEIHPRNHQSAQLRLAQAREALVEIRRELVQGARQNRNLPSKFPDLIRPLRDSLLRALAEDPLDPEVWIEAHRLIQRGHLQGRGHSFHWIGMYVLNVLAGPQAAAAFDAGALPLPPIQNPTPRERAFRWPYDPFLSDLAYLAAMSLDRLDERHIAESALTQAILLDPKGNFLARERRIELRAEKMDLHFLEDVRMLLEHHPEKLEVIFRRSTEARRGKQAATTLMIQNMLNDFVAKLGDDDEDRAMRRMAEALRPMLQGDFEAMLARGSDLADLTPPGSPVPPCMRAFALTMLGRHEEAQQALARALNHERPMGLALALYAGHLAAAGRGEEAVKAFERACDREFSSFEWLAGEPFFAPLRRLPRLVQYAEHNFREARDRVKDVQERAQARYWQRRLEYTGAAAPAGPR